MKCLYEIWINFVNFVFNSMTNKLKFYYGHKPSAGRTGKLSLCAHNCKVKVCSFLQT